ncbi:hypothetical protein ACOJAD_11110, partial [Corynebacterium amycolatum]|uniref:hypothetical protein n=1 Tax=Corynebacterium amycolatum TaxID=43765 RepID=UPI003B5B698A
GAPAEYDTAIDTSYQHNLGIQKRLDQITATRPEKTHFSLLNPRRGLRVKKCVRNRGFSRIDL